ncbi:N-acetyltransferase family protein [Thalassobius sp. Cn5-15]|uniref:GNAT family N-acetyltransferase n=1 Tax=Thalassobius sp. Cn5-15 TaxID=2917763 RepID=UPI00351CD59E
MNITIRPAAPKDAAAITAIWNRIITETTVTFTTDLKTPDGIADDISARQAAGQGYLVAVEGDQLRGLACYGPFRAGPGYADTMEHTIYLAEGAQGHGLGARLLSALEDHARTARIRCLIAAISGENTGAQRFHAAQGFAEVGRLPQVGQKFGRSLDLVLMQKLL